MLLRRKIELRADLPGLPSLLMPHQTLLDCGQAQQMLAQAHRKVDALLRAAHTASEAACEKARSEFWDMANAQLAQWATQHSALCQALESNATQVVNQALLHLLDEVPPTSRITALLAQLLRVQCPSLSTVLRCHPDAQESIQQWLSTHVENVWQLEPDESLPPLSLVLVSEHGDLHIDWFTTRDALLLPDPPDGTDSKLNTTQ
ncbi:type III secretion system stator protein SctL [Pseudomonas weihenstephanensis]|uniref:type III secretion system stator protein SctL n=1 Tax=Pseudomonas weihenstephanensis TaxID=1608994 RepID=UPI00193BE5B6|nr:type III secretion system stator protein SctL [Pseudomonas weihenstephanensis]MBM1193014.1 HrpE/YscL family type III secretion apparatus protein [Pseudomonas weihenstephanensis]